MAMSSRETISRQRRRTLCLHCRCDVQHLHPAKVLHSYARY